MTTGGWVLCAIAVITPYCVQLLASVWRESRRRRVLVRLRARWAAEDGKR
jgi:hypothetical protein